MITLLTDFGLSDHYVAAMKGVILSICPGIQVVDISHEVKPFAITEAAYTLSQAWRYFPAGTVHLVVVDPGVGTSRRPIAAEAGGHYFVAPDNGVLTMVLDAAPEAEVRHITAERYFRHPVSTTFHGRDIFAPVAAQLAGGLSPEALGPNIQDYMRLEELRPVQISDNRWHGIVLKVDHYGNITTNLDWESFRFVADRPFELRIGRHRVRQYSPTYESGRSGMPFVVRGSGEYLEVSINQGDAGSILGSVSGDTVEIQAAEPG
jgi:S-adenosylmethionine hydrolase